ncbi:MAG: AarF/ABC1/UbiB kinase family protein [Deltaproteobacteria bacterium]|nr:AarF/ABC1/UbiB kinase family protein [Deltaproteobacteria bacterium]
MKTKSKLRFVKAYVCALHLFVSYFFLGLLYWTIPRKLHQRILLWAHARNAQRLLKTILKLQGLFIKVGQTISILTHFLPEAYTKNLEQLQDAVPPCPYEEIEQRFLEEFQKKPDEIFKEFSKTPLASASLGQVHVAYLKGGEKVAVKVQYPDIETIVNQDLKILRRIFWFLDLFFPHYQLKQTFEEISSIVLQELNFINEGKNLEWVQNNLKDEKDFLFSKVYWQYSTDRILTLQFMEGIKISQVDQLKQLGVSPSEIAKKLIHAYCKQIFIDGVYHADPHPGNFLVSVENTSSQPSPPRGGGKGEGENFKIVFMDFGATARISDAMRAGAAVLIEGIIRRDNELIRKALKDMGFIAHEENEESFDKIVDFFYDRLKDIKLEQIKDFNLNNVASLQDIVEFKKLDVSFSELLHAFNVPKDWALLERAMILLLGLSTHLDPDLNPLSIIIPYAEKFVLGKNKTLGEFVIDTLKQNVLTYLQLPQDLAKILKKMNRGEMNFTSKKQNSDLRAIQNHLKKLNLCLCFFGLLFAGTILKEEYTQYSPYAFGLAGFVALLWLKNILLG